MTENDVEQAALEYFYSLGYAILHGPDIAPDEPGAERASYDDVVLFGRLQRALDAINTHIPREVRAQVIQEVISRVTRPPSLDVVQNNYLFHHLLVEGVDITYRDGRQSINEKVWLVDFDNPHNNEFLAVNQFTVTDVNPVSRAKTNRRPDIVLFVNGLPLVVIELKNAADEQADVNDAFNQIQTYKEDIASLFMYNEGVIISDGLDSRIAAFTAGWEWYKQWRTIDGVNLAPPGSVELEVLIKGVFDKARFLDLVRYFTVFEQEGKVLSKKMAQYHQYHAVNKAVEQTVRAASHDGDQKVGVIWHTQGSGKSLSMLFYAGKIIQHPAMENPTLVVLTDRNDLDDQLFGTFASGQELIRQEPVQAESRDNLKELLQVASGGVVFTTIQKFRPEGRATEYPLLSERHNIIFIADEAHRSQYGFDAHLVTRSDGDAYLAYGFAKYVRDALPNAAFIGFTGTPVELTDANTVQVFGDYIDIYDVQQAIEDKATVPIYYTNRIAKLTLSEDQRPTIDPDFEEVTEDQEDYIKASLKTKWSRLEALVGAEERLERVAKDIVTHFLERLEVLDGKGMIVCMSRRICVELYQAIVKLRPDWHEDSDEGGVIKVVMTGAASDPKHYQPHVRSKHRRKALANRFKDPQDPLRLVIVRDMWLTGFDVPPLHTMYVDKPMQGHSLMQAIARVNRVFKDKPGGLIVDYLGIATELQEAIHQYTIAKSGKPAEFLDRAVGIMQDDYDVVKTFYHRFDYAPFFDGSAAQRLAVIPQAMEHILQQHDGKKRYLEAVTRLNKSYALSKPDDRALAIRDEVSFFQAIRAAFVKTTRVRGSTSRDEMEGAIRQIVSKAVVSADVVDIFRSAGLKEPDVSILSDEFLQDVRSLPQKNLAVELLEKLLNDEIRSRSRRNAVQARSFAELLDEAIRRYDNRALDAARILNELIAIAKELREADRRGEELGLTDEEFAFYSALAENESAVEVMGNQELTIIARELLKQVRQSVSIDWTLKESARAKIRVMVKRILRKYGYPPDLQERATETVLEQAELLAADWTNQM